MYLIIYINFFLILFKNFFFAYWSYAPIDTTFGKEGTTLSWKK